jgi:hypothetical protein
VNTVIKATSQTARAAATKITTGAVTSGLALGAPSIPIVIKKSASEPVLHNLLKVAGMENSLSGVEKVLQAEAVEKILLKLKESYSLKGSVSESVLFSQAIGKQPAVPKLVPVAAAVPNEG